MLHDRPWWKSILLNALALIFGVFIAVVTVSAYTWADATFNSGYIFISPAEAAQLAAALSAKAALEVLVVAVPLWLLLKRVGWATWGMAAGLGFIAPLAWAIFNAWNHGLEMSFADDTFTIDSLPLNLCGALAGLAIWCARPRSASFSPETA